jgi:UDP-N-acetylmuramate dehydrogenase
VFKGRLKGRILIERVLFRLDVDFAARLDYKALAAALEQRHIDHPTARQVADTVRAVRDAKLPDPRFVGSAGSFFKNPVVDADTHTRLKAQYPDMVTFPVDGNHYKLAAGWLIEHAGWKGRDLGRVGVYEKQALILVNRGGATGEEVVNLCRTIQHDVADRFGIDIYPEVNFI